jgi:hypothetical protein
VLKPTIREPVAKKKLPEEDECLSALREDFRQAFFEF